MLAADTEIVVNLGFGVVFGIVCAILASGRGRSPVGWFFLGLFFSCLALILVLLLPDLKVEEERQRRHQLETRRLREQLAKERQVADQRHHQVERRLGAHDQALGLDTGEAPQLANAAPPPPLPDGTMWFYARGKERMGPVSEETVRHLLQAGAIRGDTLVWREGMADWTKAAGVDEFRGDVA